jgi:N-acetylneuraminic acid mutarotase
MEPIFSRCVVTAKSLLRYNVATNTWTTLAPVAQNVKRGGALVYANGAIYALRGDAKKDFWRYNITANSWTTLAAAPQNVRQGGALGFDGTGIYAFRGDGKPDFWRYSISTNAWSITPPPNAPANVNWGGALTYLPTGAVSLTSASASKSLVTGVSQVALRMTVTADDPISNITAGTPTYIATAGRPPPLAGRPWSARTTTSAAPATR